MAQKDTVREKRITKDTPETAQYREGIKQMKKRQEEKERKKLLKEQGVGSTIPASRKQKTQSEQLDKDESSNESSDEECDETLAEIRAEEARVDALRTKLAKRDGIRYKKLKTMDEPELQKLWDKGAANKVVTKTSTSQPENAKVKSIGPSQRIFTSSGSSSTKKGSSEKRKRTSSPAHTIPKSQGTKRKSDKKSLSNRRGSTNIKSRSMDDTESGSGSEKGSGAETDEDDSDSDTEDGVGEGDGSGSKSKSQPGKGKGSRGKTSDFTGTVKKMIDYSTVRVCAKLASSGMFIPPREYKILVSKSWTRAAAEFGVDSGNGKYALQKAQKQAIRARVNSFRSRIRDRLKPAIASVYKLLAEGRTPDEAKEYIRSLFPHGYHTRVGAPPGIGHFQHSFLEEAIFESYYTGNNPVGIVYEKWFDPMPLEAMGFVCAVIRWVIQQHETGKYVKNKMGFEKLREYYDEVMESLRAFKTGKQSQRCIVVQSTLYVRSMERAGRSVLEDKPKPAETTLRDDDFAEDIPTAEELQLLARGLSHGRKAPKSAGVSSNHLPPTLANQSNTARSQTTSQHSSPPPPSSPGGTDPAGGTKLHEEGEGEGKGEGSEEGDSSEEGEGNKEDESSEEDEDGEVEEHRDNADSTSETNHKTKNKALGSQKPPKTKRKNAETDDEESNAQQVSHKKHKGKTQSTFLEKLAGSSKKLNPKAARLQGKLKLSG